MWRIVDYAKLVVFGLVISSIFVLTVSAGATDSIVQVQVCGPAAISSLEITDPESDTVFRQLPITIQGAVEMVGQVEVYINGAYHKTVAVPFSQPDFTTTVSLQPGTHAVEVRGVSVCDGSEVQDQIVLTYEPPVEPSAPTTPSPGSKTPTVVNNSSGANIGQGGVVVNNITPIDESRTNGVNSWFGERWRQFFGPGFGGWLIFTSDIDTTWQNLSTNWLRIVLFFTGLILVVWADLLSGGRSRRRIGLRLLGIGLVLVALIVSL